MRKYVTTLAVCILLTGCSTLFNSVVTVTSVVDSAMKSWAHLSNQHQTSAAFDAKVKVLHAQYQKSCALAEQTLIIYKGTGQRDSLVAVLQTIKEGAGPLIDLIATVLDKPDSVKLQKNFNKANMP